MFRCHILVLDIVLIMVAGQTYAVTASGPLRVHPSNPRYFTDNSGALNVDAGQKRFQAPFDGDAVLYLKRQTQEGHE